MTADETTRRTQIEEALHSPWGKSDAVAGEGRRRQRELRRNAAPPSGRYRVSKTCWTYLFQVVLISCAFLPNFALAQMPPRIPQIQPFGIDGFRLMLQQRGLQATPELVGTALNEKPEETVAVVIGNLKTVAQGGGLRNENRGIQDQLTNFVRNGGALLVASDLREQRIRRASICNTWVRERRTWLRNREELLRHAYHGFNDCPVVTKFDRSAEPKLFEGLTKLVTNRPSTILNTEPSTNVAWLPIQGRPSLMSVKREGKGKMLFISDHSLFVNEMLVHGDNARFVNNVTHWLCDSEKRQRLVLIHDGQVLYNWTFGETPPSIPLSSLLRAAQYGNLADLPVGDSVLPFLNEALSRSQQENEFNKAARKAGFMLSGGRGARFGILAVAVVLMTWFFSWLVATRSRPRRWLSFPVWQQQPTRPWSLRHGQSN